MAPVQGKALRFTVSAGLVPSYQSTQARQRGHSCSGAGRAARVMFRPCPPAREVTLFPAEAQSTRAGHVLREFAAHSQPIFTVDRGRRGKKRGSAAPNDCRLVTFVCAKLREGASGPDCRSDARVSWRVSTWNVRSGSKFRRRREQLPPAEAGASYQPQAFIGAVSVSASWRDTLSDRSVTRSVSPSSARVSYSDPSLSSQ
jgi:hypothetical protein